ncbi:putative muscle M-line assembly protein unc-89-like isoform [Sesbania bispinosa]|nr:putative muscle M-line assembly protein unc-89-like isoform [Sesbania bispinosa]
MATEIVASTDELLEKKVDEEVNGQKSISLSNEHEKDEDAQGSAASFSKTEGGAKGDENKDEPAFVVVKNIDGSLSSKASFADNPKEKELIHDSQTISVTEPELAPDEAKIQLKEPPPTESTETSEDKQPKTVETIEELSNTIEANLLKESEVEVVKETEYLETSSQKVDKPEPAVTEVRENSEDPEKESQDKAQEAEQLNTVVVSDPSAETAEKPCVAKESTEPIVQQVLEKKSQENTQEVQQPTTVAISAPSPETNEKLSDVMEKNTREPTSLKVEKTDAQVSLDEETQATTTSLVESSSHAVAEKVIEEDGNKESDCTEEIKSVSKEVVDVSKDPEQAFIKHEAKTDLKQETEYSAPINIEEKVATNDDNDNKQQGTPAAAEGSSREAEVEIKKDDRPAADSEKQGHPETKVEIRETLASKLEEKVQDEAEPPTKENNASKDLPPKETPAKPTQKQSNNIISTVKKSLIKSKESYHWEISNNLQDHLLPSQR